MQRTILAVTIALLLLASAPSEAARPRQQVLDRDSVVLSLLGEEPIWYFTLLRGPNGQALLRDESDASPARVTPLGIPLAQGPATATFQALPELDSNGNAVVAITSGDAIHVVALAGLGSGGPLDVTSLGQVTPGSGFDPTTVQTGIIAILIGLAVDPHAIALSYERNGAPVSVARIDGAWAPVGLREDLDPFWCPVAACDHELLDSDGLALPNVEQENIFELLLLRAPSGEALLLDAGETTPPRATPLGFAAPVGSDKGSYTATPRGTVWAAFASATEIRVHDLGDLSQPGPLAPVEKDVVHPAGAWDPATVRTGIIAILIGLTVEPRPALYIGETEKQIVLGWNGTAFAPVRMIEEEGIYYFF